MKNVIKKDIPIVKENPFSQFKKRDQNLPQGYNKFIEYIEELRRNIHFKKDFEEFCQFIRKNKNGKEVNKKIFNFCKKYNIPVGTLEGFGYISDGDRFFWGWVAGDIFNYDMCHPLDLYSLFYEKNESDLFMYNLTKDKNLVIKSLINCFPVAIALHKFSTKRDLLDFIEKEWNTIEEILSRYREKPYRGRNKKIDWDMVDFIWENRNLRSKEIKEKLNAEFPQNGLVYNDILKIISLEKKKRNKNIAQDKKYPRKDLIYDGLNNFFRTLKPKGR